MHQDKCVDIWSIVYQWQILNDVMTLRPVIYENQQLQTSIIQKYYSDTYNCKGNLALKYDDGEQK